MNNFAFIDGQNLYAGNRELGWAIDFGRFRDYLGRKYGVVQAYYFIGYISHFEPVYRELQRAGYELIFKPVVHGPGHDPKGNIDADLVLQAMIDFDAYDQAIVLSGDGDVYSLVRHLHDHNKLRAVLAPNRRFCSALLKQHSGGRLWFVEDLRGRVGR